MAEQLLTVAQAAKQLQIHPYTLRRYLREGKIRATKISRHYRIAPSDLKSLGRQATPSDKVSILREAREKLRGTFGNGNSVDRFLAEKHAETAREEWRYQENLAERIASGLKRGKLR